MIAACRLCFDQGFVPVHIGQERDATTRLYSVICLLRFHDCVLLNDFQVMAFCEELQTKQLEKKTKHEELQTKQLDQDWGRNVTPFHPTSPPHRKLAIRSAFAKWPSFGCGVVSQSVHAPISQSRYWTLLGANRFHCRGCC